MIGIRSEQCEATGERNGTKDVQHANDSYLTVVHYLSFQVFEYFHGISFFCSSISQTEFATQHLNEFLYFNYISSLCRRSRVYLFSFKK